MRIELRIGLALIALGLVLNRFVLFSEPVSNFLCGAFMSFGMFFMVVNLLPEKTYNKLLYRKLIKNKN